MNPSLCFLNASGMVFLEQNDCPILVNSLLWPPASVSVWKILWESSYHEQAVTTTWIYYDQDQVKGLICFPAHDEHRWYAFSEKIIHVCPVHNFVFEERKIY